MEHQNRPLTDIEIRDNLNTILIAGYGPFLWSGIVLSVFACCLLAEGTANTLGAFVYEVAQNPEASERSNQPR